MCHSTHVGASSATVNGTYRDGRSRAKQIAHCFPDESWCQWMSVKNAISSVTVKTVDIHRPKRRGCKTLITANDKSAASRCANQERYAVPWAIYRQARWSLSSPEHRTLREMALRFSSNF